MRKAAAILALATLFGCGGTDVDVPPAGNLPEGRTIADRGEPDLQPFDLTVDRPLKRGRLASQCNIIPPHLSFGIVPPGRSATVEAAMRNDGGLPCRVTDVTVAEGVAMFGIEDGMLLHPGADIRFGVSIAGFPPLDEPWTVLSFRVDGEYRELVLGAGEREPCLLLAPATVAFAPTGAGCTSEQAVAFVNVCEGPLDLTALTTSSAEFAVELAEPVTLQRGEQHVATVRFSPAAARTYEATLTASTSELEQQITLTGIGTEDACPAP